MCTDKTAPWCAEKSRRLEHGTAQRCFTPLHAHGNFPFHTEFRTCTCAFVGVYKCTYIYLYNIYIYICIYICIHIYIYVYTYTYMYMYIEFRLQTDKEIGNLCHARSNTAWHMHTRIFTLMHTRARNRARTRTRTFTRTCTHTHTHTHTHEVPDKGKMSVPPENGSGRDVWGQKIEGKNAPK